MSLQCSKTMRNDKSNTWSNVLIRAFLRSEEDRLNIDIYRGFIERFGLFG